MAKLNAQAPTSKITKKEPTIGQMIDRLDELRESKRKLGEQEKVIVDEYKALEQTLIEKLGAEGMEKATGQRASASINKVVVADIVDDKALFAYVKKTGYFHLFQRRISDPAFRELYELSKGKGVPGLQPFTKINLNLRSLS